MSKVYAQPALMDNIVEKFDLKNAAIVEVGDLLVTSGIGAFDIETGETLSGEDIKVHANHALDTYEQVLQALGFSLDHVVKVGAFLRYPERDYAGWNEVYLDRFSDPYPCRTSVGGPLVAGIIELDLWASREPRRLREG